jgi:aryl-alcohol dehydrogenase-like predicted oxidoreductase
MDTRAPETAVPGRRHFLGSALALSALAVMPQPAHASTSAQATRLIPSDGRRLAVVGLGTWQTFDVGNDVAARDNLGRLLSRFAELGGELIDSSPMYGSAEAVVGDLVHDKALRQRVLLATKLWTRGREAGVAQMAESLRRLRTSRIDLMQVHNLQDWQLHLPSLRAWKAEGRIRYLGITHYSASAYGEIEAILRKEPLDFLQINYSLAEPESARRLLPLAAERGVAVIVNRPFAEGALFSAVAGRTLPAEAASHGCGSWAQLFLRWILAHPAVSCVIPASRRIEHLEDNMGAAATALPDFGEQKALARMAGF